MKSEYMRIFKSNDFSQIDNEEQSETSAIVLTFVLIEI